MTSLIRGCVYWLAICRWRRRSLDWELTSCLGTRRDRTPRRGSLLRMLSICRWRDCRWCREVGTTTGAPKPFSRRLASWDCASCWCCSLFFAFGTTGCDVVWAQWTNDVEWGKGCSKRSRDDGLLMGMREEPGYMYEIRRVWKVGRAT